MLAVNTSKDKKEFQRKRRILLYRTRTM